MQYQKLSSLVPYLVNWCFFKSCVLYSLFCCWIILLLLLHQTNSPTGIIKVSFYLILKYKFNFESSHLHSRFSHSPHVPCLRFRKNHVWLPECIMRLHNLLLDCLILLISSIHFPVLFSDSLHQWLSKVVSNLVNLTPLWHVTLEA